MKTKRRNLFICMIVFSFLAILIYNIFTPTMSDDLSYGQAVSEADSFFELFRQEYQQYMTWTGRSVNHIILRCFLLGDKWLFNILNSLAFVALTLFMYYNIENRKKWDIFVYILINLFVWIFGVSFAQTVLWETGACNYLWGSTIIMGYISAVRFCMNKDYMGRWFQVAQMIGLFILGILAGWCNENTSGGCILVVCLWIGFYIFKNKKMQAWMVCGLAGNLIGFLFMILAPGNANRKYYMLMEEEHTGLFAIVSRFLKCNIVIHNHFFILIAICIVTLILVRTQKAEWVKSKNMLIFFFVFVATCYALILTPEPMARAYFGAGIFLIISCVQGISDVSDEDKYIGALKLSAVAIFALYFVFTYMECGAHLMRIYRESRERFIYIEEQKALGNMDITVPLLRPDFENKYSFAYDSDFDEDSGYWVNTIYASYYGIHSISAVPRDEWSEY